MEQHVSIESFSEVGCNMGKQIIGKLYLHWSKRGIAYKWGEDGEIHRFTFGRTTPRQDNQRVYYADEDGYDNQPGYGDDYNSGYDSYGQQYAEPDRFAILWQHPWLFALLLIVFPPLGIWALWKRNQFDMIVQAVISAVSLVWFIIVLVWIVSGITGSPDPVNASNQPNAGYTTNSPSPTNENQLGIATTSPTAQTDETGGDSTQGINLLEIEGDVQSSASPSPQSTDAVQAETTTYVYIAQSGSGTYYHKNETCNNIPYSNRVTLSFAKGKGFTQCPTCFGSSGTPGGTSSDTTTYYMTSGGKNYHTISTCSGMKGARTVTKEEAEKAGKTACPTCASAYYYTATGKYYHLTANCTGMKGATKATRAEALATGKEACPTCFKKSSGSSSGQVYYATKSGKYYHKNSTCTGMKNASKISLNVAKQRKQTACPVCIGSGSDSGSQKYYATKSGKYYHTKSNCTGMKNATSISLTAAKKANKKACPTCVGSAGSTSSPSTYVYMTNSGKYYHSKSGCTGMTGAKKVSISTAKESGKTACPVCISGGATATPSPTRTSSSGGSVDETTYCYASSGNKYFHKTSGCSGMINATRMTVKEAKSKGKTICPVCQSKSPLPTRTTEPTVYGTKNNKYYHSKSSCSGMTNASKLKLSDAKSKKLTACPVCISGKSTSSPNSTNTSTKTVDPTCYTSSGDNYYHAKRSCSLASSPSKTTLSKAKNKGKSACPYCAGTSLDTMVFVSSKGKLYHSKSSCNGVNMDIKACLSEAVNKGYKRCSRCSPPRVTSKPTTPVTAAPVNN